MRYMTSPCLDEWNRYFLLLNTLAHGHTRFKISIFSYQNSTGLFVAQILFLVPNYVLVCLCVWSSSSHSRILHSYGDVTITGEGLQILTNARHSKPLSSEGSLACHCYCDTGIRLKWSSPRTRDTHTYCRRLCSGAVTTCFYELRLSRLGFEHPTFRLLDQSSHVLHNRRCPKYVKSIHKNAQLHKHPYFPSSLTYLWIIQILTLFAQHSPFRVFN